MIAEANRILLIHGHPIPRLDIRRALSSRYAYSEYAVDSITETLTEPPMAVIIDVPLQSEADAHRARQAISRLPDPSVGRAFVIDDRNRLSIARAHAYGGEIVIPRPLSDDSLFPAIDLLLAKARSRLWALAFGKNAKGLEAGTQALERIFQLAASGSRLTQHELYGRGDVMIASLAETGLGNWIEAVKAHHSQTFRHSLLVTGVAVGFGQHLGMRHEDLQRLALGGLLHDIGKAAVPIEILEKPSNLTPEEMVIMREHPDLGRRILKRNGGFSPEMLDIVAHHHEMLDGTGYPDGLSGNQISDIVRVMTISDIFSALIEQRAYKSTIPNDEAYRMVQKMGGKLDPALVRAFEPIAMKTRLAA